MMPPEEYGEFDLQIVEEDDFMDDEEALEALRDVESAAPPPAKAKAVEQRSPAKKRARLSSEAEKMNVALEDITNLSVPSSAASINLVTEKAYRAPRLGERKVYRRIPLEGNYQSFTMSDGERFYVKVKSDEDEETMSSLPKTTGGGLCGESYSSLLEEAIQEQMRMQQAASTLEVVSAGDSGIESSSDDDSNSLHSLWVEKFKPRSYMQLLSDDGTNRTLLHWLKLWDKVVFDKDPPKKPPPKNEDPAGNNDNFKKKFTSNNELIEDLDDTHRPQQKTALLYGPPGLGKTTLAHVVAKHAGYNVVEINASDDRSLAAFKVKLEAATQMKSVNNQDKRPNCLVIDEIDGAPAPTITYLVNLLNGKAASAGGKKSKKQESLLQRPIICICNDLYVPALRPLRQISLLLQFPPTSSQRLVQRLSYISGKEQMQTDLTALMALCEKSGNDIRSCLSTLQFFKSKGKRMSSMDVHRSFVGNKDSHKSHFSVWQELFQMPRQTSSSKRKFDSSTPTEKSTSPGARFKSALSSVMACGDYEKLQQGVFENYLNVKFKDTKLHNVQAGQEWFCFFDVMQQHILHSQTYATMAYMPYNFVATHLLFAAPGRFKVSYPTEAYEMRSALTKSKQTVESLYGEMSPAVRCYTSTTGLVRDSLPCLLQIIQPNLRPVNTQLFSKSEKEMLEKVIATFLAYSRKLFCISEKQCFFFFMFCFQSILFKKGPLRANIRTSLTPTLKKWLILRTFSTKAYRMQSNN